jgi:hypothetical protein
MGCVFDSHYHGNDIFLVFQCMALKGLFSSAKVAIKRKNAAAAGLKMKRFFN